LATILTIVIVVPRAVVAEARAASGPGTWHIFGPSSALGLYYPYGLATDARRDVFIADAGNFRIVRVSPSGKLLNQWRTAGSGPGEFGGPVGPTRIAADRQGHVLVADIGNHRIEKFSSSGKLLAQWVLDSYHLDLLAVAVDAAGDVYIARSWAECSSDSGCTTGTVVEKRSASGRVVATWYLSQSAGAPSGLAIAVDPAGASYVLSSSTGDEGVNEIQFEKRSATGAVLGYGDTSVTPGATQTRRSGRDRLSVPLLGDADPVATDWQGNVYVITTFSGGGGDLADRFKVEERSRDGKLLRRFDVTIGRGSVNLNLTVDRHGYVYIADSVSGHITRVVPAGSGGARWPSEPQGEWLLRYPADVAVDRDGNVYVADTGNSRIVKLSLAGTPLAHWGKAGAGVGQLREPGGIAVDGAGNVFVADCGNRRVQVFSSAGQVIGKWPLSYLGDCRIAVGRNGNVYVLFVGSHEVSAYLPTGDVLAGWAFSPQLGPGDKLGSLGGIAVDEAGNVYVTDQSMHRIVKFSAQGTALAQWTLAGLQASSTAGVIPTTGLAVDGQGNIYVVEAGTDTLDKLAPDGTVTDRWGTRGVKAGQFHTPDGVAVDAVGNLYVADTGNNRIQKLTVTG
jgi:sugar lactone lactonase YvrE